MRINIIGCGLSGITAAVLLKKRGHHVEVFENKNHIGGNCYDSNVCGTMVHNYGPHIFHTNDEEVYRFLSEYTEFLPFEYKPYADSRLGMVSLPYSQKTVSQLGRELSQEEIIEYFFREYSEKQWGVPFKDIPSSIINRVPRLPQHKDPTWYGNQKYQCIPKYGYTEMMKNMLNGITVHTGIEVNEWRKYNADLVIYTGKVDEYFNYCAGRLPYRSLRFEHTVTGDRQFNVVVNQTNSYNKFTRIYDHSFFTYKHKGLTVITKEFPLQHDETNLPFYPIPFGSGISLYNNVYNPMAKSENNVLFLGRLATYKYLDMWMAVKQAMIGTKNIA